MTRGIVSPRTLALAIGAAFVPEPVLSGPGPIAEIICAPTEQMTRRLETQFGAERAWQGLRSPEEVMELWEDKRGDWTLVIARANGTLCIVAMGVRVTGFPDMPRG